MFGRRIKLSFPQRIKESLWPSMGWTRTYHYFRHRILRQSATPGQIASGLAIGAGVSFTPLLGTHFIQAIFFSWVFRANMLAGFVGTAVGNPWTFPFMFWLSYHVGKVIFTSFGMAGMIEMPEAITLEYLLANPLRLLLPLTIGGFACAVLSWPVFYAAFYFPVKAMHKTYHLQRQRRLEEKP